MNAGVGRTSFLPTLARATHSIGNSSMHSMTINNVFIATIAQPTSPVPMSQKSYTQSLETPLRGNPPSSTLIRLPASSSPEDKLTFPHGCLKIHILFYGDQEIVQSI